MPIDVQAICDALAVNLRTVAGDVQVTPFYDDTLPVDANWLVAEIGPKFGTNEVNLEEAAATDTWVLHCTVTLYLAHLDAETAQQRMLGFLGIAHGDTASGAAGASVWNALTSDRSLGGLARKVLVRRSHSYAVTQRDSQRLITNSWDVDVEATA